MSERIKKDYKHLLGSPSENKDRDMSRLADLTQLMIYNIAAIQKMMDLSTMPPDFAKTVGTLAEQYQTAAPLTRKYLNDLAKLRQGRTVTIAGVTCRSQTACVVVLAGRLLRKIADAIPKAPLNPSEN